MVILGGGDPLSRGPLLFDLMNYYLTHDTAAMVTPRAAAVRKQFVWPNRIFKTTKRKKGTRAHISGKSI